MIFDRFFKPKWQNKDANVRIEALNEFDINNPEQQQILAQLFTQDSSELVRRASLIKLDNFVHWFSAFQHNDLAAIKRFAEARVQELILTSEAVTAAQKQSYLSACAKSPFLDQWLLQEHDATLLRNLLEKVNKPNVLSQLLLKTDNVDLQNQLLSDINDIDLLEKLLKKSAGKSVFPLIESKVLMFRAEIEKPIKLRKQIQLCLSKLLALKDIVEYEDMLQRKTLIATQWEEFNLDFPCLPTAEQQQLNDRYRQINTQLKKHFIVLEEAYQQQRIIKERALKLEQQQKMFADSINEIALKITNAVFDNDELNEVEVAAQLSVLEDKITQSLLSSSSQTVCIKQIDALKYKLTKLPEVAQSVSAATALIAKFSGLAVPSTVEDFNLSKPLFDDWNTQWRSINKLANDILPESLTKARDELHQNWHQAIQEFSQQQEQVFNHFRKKLAELKRLISYGKYKSAFGLHKKLTFIYNDLAEQYQAKLSKEYDVVTHEIKELHELESFVVTPRKQQLLDEVKQLVALPLDNPGKQAEQVKLFRKQWNLLGHASDELEQTLNLEFNNACEEAFAPCRQYYAEQGKIREQHLKAKQLVLKDIALLGNEINAESVNWQQIDAKLTKLMAKWRETGEIDRAQYQLLLKEYRNLVDPIKNGIHKFQDGNVVLKQALIAEAKKYSADEDVFSSINHLKEIQQKWRNIGYAGPQKENQLWQSFRQINDQLFARRDEVVKAQKVEKNAELQSFELTLSSLVVKVTDIQSSEINNLLAEFNQFIDELKALNPIPKGLLNKANEQISRLNKKVSELDKAKVLADIDNLFNTISYIANEENAFANLQDFTAFKALPNTKQKLILNSQNLNRNDELQARLTIELEILAKLESPEALKSKRRQIQVELLADKLMQGEVSIDDKFQQWLSCASFEAMDVSLINRVKAVISQL